MMRTGLALLLIFVALVFGFYSGWTVRNALVVSPVRSGGVFGGTTPALPHTPLGLKIEDVDTKVTENNDVWAKFAWRLTVSNQGDEDEAFAATLEWQDKDGFVVDSQEQYHLAVTSHGKQTFTGYTLISHPAADKVQRIVAKLTR
jgi:hypothetical protein